MDDTDSAPSDMMITPGLATLHVPRPGGGWRRGIFPSEEIRGEGALVSTVDDMLRWLAHLRGPKVVGTEETWRQMLSPPTLRDGTSSIYALGLHVHDHRGVRVIHHAGAVIGGSAQVLAAPAHGLDIVMLSNGAPLSPMPTVYRILEAVLGDELGPPGPELAALERWRHLEDEYYADGTGLVIGFGPAAAHLGISIMGSPPYPVLRDTGDMLRVGFEEAALGPIEITTAALGADAQGGAPDAIRVKEAGVAHNLVRLRVDGAAAACAARSLAGRYRSVDLAADAVVAVDEQAPRIAIRGEFGAFSGTLRFLSWDVALVYDAGSPVSAGVIARSPGTGSAHGFRVSMARGRGFTFDRVE